MRCCICGSPVLRPSRHLANDSHAFDCPICGPFRITEEGREETARRTPGERTLLSGWIRERRLRGEPPPFLLRADAGAAATPSAISIPEALSSQVPQTMGAKLARVLRNLGALSGTPGSLVQLREDDRAVCYAGSRSEMLFYLETLRDAGMLDRLQDGAEVVVRLSAAAWDRLPLEELPLQPDVGDLRRSMQELQRATTQTLRGALPAWRSLIESRNWGLPVDKAQAPPLAGRGVSPAAPAQVLPIQRQQAPHLAIMIVAVAPGPGWLTLRPEDEPILRTVPGTQTVLPTVRWGATTFDATGGGTLLARAMHIHYDEAGLIEFGASLVASCAGRSIFVESLSSWVLTTTTALIGIPLSRGRMGGIVVALALSGIEGYRLASRSPAWTVGGRDTTYRDDQPLRLSFEAELPDAGAEAERIAGDFMIRICRAFNAPVAEPWRFAERIG